MQYMLPALTLLFIGLKLTDHIDWSWFWVLSPMIFAVTFTIFLLAGGAALAWRILK